MQLVQPSKFFSVTIFRTRFHRQYWPARVRTWAMLLFLVTLMFVQSLWELHALFSEQVYKPLVLHASNFLGTASLTLAACI